MVTASVPEHARLAEGPVANVLMLGTAEWDSPIATNQHYVARELARSATVTFVESLGLRRPTLRRDDVVRMAARVRRAMGDRETPAQRPRPAGAHVVSPIVLPVHRTPTRPLNRALLRRATADWLASPRPRVLWTFTPVTYGLEEAADVVVYHCVDLLATFPGVDGVAVARGERSLSSRTAVAIATSSAVHEHLVAAGFPRVDLLPNVADVSVFTAASRPAAERRPAVLFSGNLTVHKLDLPLLESVATAVRGHGELLLAGPLAAGGGSFDAELRRLEDLGARHLGVLTPAQLAEVAGTCAVGLIPYAINDYTRGVSPLKCFEYLSSGLAVLSTGLPAVTELAGTNPHVTAAAAAELPARVPELLQPVGDEIHGARMASAAEHGWEGRGALLRELLSVELNRPRS
ncbi:glycosyl transferase family 1 [Micromonospora krabiensis]|uniref:Glycosyltransferase involved in cell wall bisynthesis n=1 Tax=Micromonospora krabiensis TaxID=307121 RepID=A0A1C3N4W7_9ACTN|nr:glycosyl transferase family 1 [Micromonospora krabiensis]SBV27624.1 Glycosyltransferase involved in cell wall bisynthesis [Micromonospora krabiensis]